LLKKIKLSVIQKRYFYPPSGRGNFLEGDCIVERVCHKPFHNICHNNIAPEMEDVKRFGSIY
jgi:hypothetical protein